MAVAECRAGNPGMSLLRRLPLPDMERTHKAMVELSTVELAFAAVRGNSQA